MATRNTRIVALLLGASLLAGCNNGSAGSEDTGRSQTQVAETEYPQQVLWGDTHLHTSNSIDAFGFGNRLDPEAALRFAKGEEVAATTGMKAKLDRPLDFLVIADHSDGLGATKALADAPRLLLTDPTMRRWHDLLNSGPEGSQRATAELINAAATGSLPEAMRDSEASRKRQRGIWEGSNAIVERYNDPGKFTAFIGFEFTLMPDGNNLHRVVMFRDGADKANKVFPLASRDENSSMDELWDYMDGYEKATGGKMLAIPHNSNLSNGMMFEMVGPDGGPMAAEYARKRAAHEPVVEVTQIKGDSEAHPFLSPNDEFAGYGVDGWELGNLPMTNAKTNGMFAGEYVREALKRGLAIEAATGVNPYKLGMIGSTDSHTSLATGDESNFFGKHTGTEPSAARAAAPQNLGTRGGRVGWHYLAGGYAAVWATANSRAAIFDALMRREVYATTGPRMVVRFFAGQNFKDDLFGGDWVKAGYTGGVPMGGELVGGKSSPIFVISALKDPQGANLDRVQVVKGWTDASGRSFEKVYDVAWSSPETRKPSGGKLPPVGDTVDLAVPSYSNSIGAPELRKLWRDPDYRPGQRAFYYLRVLEIPTPSWPAYDAVRFKVKPPAEAILKRQERAYSSPIWVNPPRG